MLFVILLFRHAFVSSIIDDSVDAHVDEEQAQGRTHNCLVRVVADALMHCSYVLAETDSNKYTQHQAYHLFPQHQT